MVAEMLMDTFSLSLPPTPEAILGVTDKSPVERYAWETPFSYPCRIAPKSPKSTIFAPFLKKWQGHEQSI